MSFQRNASPEQHAYFIALAENYRNRAATARDTHMAARYAKLADKYYELALGLVGANGKPLHFRPKFNAWIQGSPQPVGSLIIH